MAKNGGYRKPSKPAAVSGPGKYSRRTDGQPSEESMKQAKRYVTGMDYGDNKELNEIQSQGDLAAGPSMANTPSPVLGQPSAPTPAPAAATQASAPTPQSIPLSDVPSLFGATERTTEPITAGAPMGPGPGPEALMGTQEQAISDADRERLMALYGMVMAASEKPNASQLTKQFARRLRSLI